MAWAGRDLGAVMTPDRSLGATAGSGWATSRSVGGLCGGLGLPLCVAGSHGKALKQGSNVARFESERPTGCHLLTHWRGWRPEQGQWGWGEWTDWRALEEADSPAWSWFGCRRWERGEGTG